MTKKLLLLLSFCQLSFPCNATDIMRVSDSINLEFAQKNGLEFKSSDFADSSEKKFNFTKFKVCEAESVLSQTFDQKGNVQISSELISKGGWYSFTLNKQHKNNWRIVVHCKSGTGQLGFYFISPKKISY